MNATVQTPVYRCLELAGRRVECALFQPVLAAPDRRTQTPGADGWSVSRLVLLHEGLEEHRGADFMHREAGLPLSSLRAQLGLRKPVLIGHSDGASIALLHASHHRSDTRAIVALAPHLFVESVCIESIRKVSEDFQASDLQTRLARYHVDARRTFEGWSRIWLAEEFKTWNIEAEVARISCPILAVQGFDDRSAACVKLIGSPKSRRTRNCLNWKTAATRQARP